MTDLGVTIDHPTSASSTSLRLAEAIPLVHAMIGRVAQDLGIRALFIKGPSLNEQELRTPRMSTDADVLVDPSRHGELVRGLEALGWYARDLSTKGRVMAFHSVTLIHDSWPCDIDAHFRYPGFFAADQDTFETMWANRSTITLAHHEVICADRVTNALILAVHALRSPKAPRNKAEFTELIARIRRSFTDEERASILALTAAYRARETLRPLLAQLDLDTSVRDLSTDERRAWNMIISDETSTLGWYASIVSARWPDKPRIVFRAIIPTEEDFRADHPECPPGKLSLVRGHIRRIGKGLRSFPRAFRTYLRNVRRT